MPAITINLVDLISWGLTIVSVVLFLGERKKNDRRPSYMAMQGILKANNEYLKFLAHCYGNFTKRNSQAIPKDEVILYADAIYANNLSLREHIMGAMKSLEPDKDIPFDTQKFLEGDHLPGQTK